MEELLQSLGFMHDIDNPTYRNVSILDDRGSGVTALGLQDIIILQMKYPGE